MHDGFFVQTSSGGKTPTMLPQQQSATVASPHFPQRASLSSSSLSLSSPICAPQPVGGYPTVPPPSPPTTNNVLATPDVSPAQNTFLRRAPATSPPAFLLPGFLAPAFALQQDNASPTTTTTHQATHYSVSQAPPPSYFQHHRASTPPHPVGPTAWPPPMQTIPVVSTTQQLVVVPPVGAHGKGAQQLTCDQIHFNLPPGKAAPRLRTLPPGRMVRVHDPNERHVYQEVPSERILVTKGSEAYWAAPHLGLRVFHCTHFHTKRMCNRGETCTFIHALREATPPPLMEVSTTGGNEGGVGGTAGNTVVLVPILDVGPGIADPSHPLDEVVIVRNDPYSYARATVVLNSPGASAPSTEDAPGTIVSPGLQDVTGAELN